VVAKITSGKKFWLHSDTILSWWSKIESSVIFVEFLKMVITTRKSSCSSEISWDVIYTLPNNFSSEINKFELNLFKNLFLCRNVL